MSHRIKTRSVLPDSKIKALSFRIARTVEILINNTLIHYKKL